MPGLEKAKGKSLPAYLQDPCILIQFILFESVSLFSKLTQLSGQIDLNLTKSSRFPIFQRLKSLGILFKTNFSDPPRLFPYLSKSSFNKLDNYFIQLSIVEKTPNITLKPFQESIQSLYDHLSNLQSSETVTIGKKELKQLSQKLIHLFEQFAGFIKMIAEKFWDNENIILFLLLHRKEFDSIYGNNFIPSLLQSLYPKGFSDIQKFLIQQFETRGFSHLVPQIESEISSLESFIPIRL